MSALDGIRERATTKPAYSWPHEAQSDRHRLLDALDAVLEVHYPIDAAMYSGSQQRIVQVCTGCGQDDGNWNRYPCPTVRAINTALDAA